jgi:8-oxo-dGTP pyrophosphatase MutT (NUDIX family)
MASLWEKVDETPYRLQAGFGKIILKTFRLPHGEVSHYDIKDQGAVACVLALTPENKVILAQQFRPGPEQLLLEMPGGCVDAGEAPEAAIRRELLEETGYTGSFHYAFVGVQRSAEKRPDDQHRWWLYVSRYRVQPTPPLRHFGPEKALVVQPVLPRQVVVLWRRG